MPNEALQRTGKQRPPLNAKPLPNRSFRPRWHEVQKSLFIFSQLQMVPIGTWLWHGFLQGTFAAGCGTQRAYPKQYNRPSWDPMTMRPPAMAGEAESGDPVSNSQTLAPVARSSTYKRPSFDPM